MPLAMSQVTSWILYHPLILQIGEAKAAVIHLTDMLIICHVLGRHGGQSCGGDKEHMGTALPKELTLE